MLRRQLLCTLLLLCVLRLFGCTPARLGAASAPVSISVYPSFSGVPATFRARAMITRDPANRMLCYGYEGPEYKRSCVGLDGEKSDAVFQRNWDLRTGGEYVAFADLVQSEQGKDRHVVVRQPFQVISPFQ